MSNIIIKIFSKYLRNFGIKVNYYLKMVCVYLRMNNNNINTIMKFIILTQLHINRHLNLATELISSYTMR